MTDAKLVRHLKVLTDKAEAGPVPTLKFFSIGDPAEVEGEGEVLPILSWVDDNLSRYVVSNAASSQWGRSFPLPGSPLPFVHALPNRAVKKKDALFLLTRAGEDRDEPNPAGEGRLHFVHLGVQGGASARLWSTPGSAQRIYIYKLDAVQTRALLPPRANERK
jgi:hypothetical protein